MSSVTDPNALERLVQRLQALEAETPARWGTLSERAIRSLRDFAASPDESLAPSHSAFGPMSASDWRRWAYRHTDHHLKQFAL